ncbi:MAG: tetratricopeptide repeat protein, partial [Isosphaeraceae bacterium]
QTGRKLAWYEPRDLKLAITRAELARESGDSSHSAEILRDISSRVGDSISENFELGLKLKDFYLFDQALEHLEFGLGREPRNLSAHRAVVEILGIERRSAEQEIALWKWVKSGESPVEALRLLAQWQVVIPPGAIPKTSDEGETLSQQLAAEPDSADSTAALACFYRNRGELQKASEIVSKALKKKPDSLNLIAERLAGLLDSGEREVAGQQFAELGENVMKSPELLWLRAEYYRINGNFSKAIEDYESGLKQGGRDPKIYFKMAECARLGEMKPDYKIYLNKYEKSRQLTYDAADVDSLNPEVGKMIKLAMTSMELGRTTEAKAWSKEVLRRDQANVEARKILEVESIK